MKQIGIVVSVGIVNNGPKKKKDLILRGDKNE